MKWIIAGFFAVLIYLERHGLMGIYNRIRRLVNMNEIKARPRFDGLETVVEILDWVSEPLEVLERVDRLRDAMHLSLHFNFFIRQVMGKDFSYLQVAEGGLDYKPTHLDRWVCAHTGNAWIELPRYADDSTIAMPRRKNQLVQVLDHVWAPEAKIMHSLILGEYKLPDRVNHKIVELALGEAQGQST